MLELVEWLLLRAVFNPDLHDAIIAMDKEHLKEIIFSCYQHELNNGYIYNVSGADTEDTKEAIASLNMMDLKMKWEKELREDDFSWAI